MHIPFRRIVLAHDGAWSDELDTRGIGRYNDNRLSLVWVRVSRVTEGTPKIRKYMTVVDNKLANLPLTHDKVNSASRITSTRNPPLQTINNNFAVFTLD